MKSPYHSGEREIQNFLKETSLADVNGLNYRDWILPNFVEFLSNQNLFVLSTAEPSGEIPITILWGRPGFIKTSEDGRRLIIALDPQLNSPNNPVLRSLELNQCCGGLAIEFPTRSRLRVNGHIVELTSHQFCIEIDESYVQCSKYIKKGNLTPTNFPEKLVSDTRFGNVLTSEIKKIITSADTFFVSSFNPQGHADASHRGGNPGFIKIENDHELIIPDFRGNSMYNTLGNFKLNPQAGLVFFDTNQSSLLHLHGRVTLDIMAPEERPRSFLITGETGRFWHFKVHSWELIKANYSLIFKP